MERKSILVIETPKVCYVCPCSDEGCYLCQISRRQLEDDFQERRPSWCPLRHPLKEVSNDFYIYDRKFLFDHLNEEIAILKGTKAFKEFMKAREEE